MWALHSYSVSYFSSYFCYGGKLFCVVEYRDTVFGEAKLVETCEGVQVKAAGTKVIFNLSVFPSELKVNFSLCFCYIWYSSSPFVIFKAAMRFSRSCLRFLLKDLLEHCL